MAEVRLEENINVLTKVVDILGKNKTVVVMHNTKISILIKQSKENKSARVAKSGQRC